jgi:hypothetical protein
MTIDDYIGFYFYDKVSGPPVVYSCGKCARRLTMQDVLDAYRTAQREWAKPTDKEVEELSDALGIGEEGVRDWFSTGFIRKISLPLYWCNDERQTPRIDP